MSKNEKFEERFKEYKDLLIRIVISKTGDFQVAQEICQQVFCAYYIRMDEIEDEMVKAWLIRCTRNAIVDYLRKAGLKKEISLVNGYYEVGNCTREIGTAGYEDRVINTELTGRILKDVRSVNESWYRVLVMICVDGMSHRQAAKILHVSEEGLRAKLYRARNYVRKKFGDEYWGN